MNQTVPGTQILEFGGWTFPEIISKKLNNSICMLTRRIHLQALFYFLMAREQCLLSNICWNICHAKLNHEEQHWGFVQRNQVCFLNQIFKTVHAVIFWPDQICESRHPHAVCMGRCGNDVHVSMNASCAVFKRESLRNGDLSSCPPNNRVCRVYLNICPQTVVLSSWPLCKTMRIISKLLWERRSCDNNKPHYTESLPSLGTRSVQMLKKLWSNLSHTDSVSCRTTSCYSFNLTEGWTLNFVEVSVHAPEWESHL